MSKPAVASEQPDAAAAPSPFHRMSDFLAIPRLGGLALSADGTRLVVSVATLDAEKKKWQSALWEIDPAGIAAARRLTRSAPGESAPAWLPDGSMPTAMSVIRPTFMPAPRAAVWAACNPVAARHCRKS